MPLPAAGAAAAPNIPPGARAPRHPRRLRAAALHSPALRWRLPGRARPHGRDRTPRWRWRWQNSRAPWLRLASPQADSRCCGRMPRRTCRSRADPHARPLRRSWPHSIAELPDGVYQIRKPGAVRIELHRRQAASQIDLRLGHAGPRGEFSLDRTRAIAAGHALDGDFDGFKTHPLMMHPGRQRGEVAIAAPIALLLLPPA